MAWPTAQALLAEVAATEKSCPLGRTAVGAGVPVPAVAEPESHTAPTAVTTASRPAGRTALVRVNLIDDSPRKQDPHIQSRIHLVRYHATG